jgi:PAS domain S-box-containing protein
MPFEQDRSEAARMDGTDIRDVGEALRVYEQIVSGVPDHLSFVDRDYVYRAVNEAYLVAHDTSEERIVGRAVPEVMGHDVFERTVKPQLDRCLGGESVHYEAWFDFAGKGRRLMDVSYFPYRDREGVVTGVVVNARDITEQRSLEEQLRHSQKMEAMGRLAGGVAHDFNNYLTIILTCLRTQEKRLDDGAAVRELIEPMREAAQRAVSLTSHLLAFARRQDVEPRVIDPADVIKDILRWLEPLVGDDVRVSLDVQAQPGYVELDPGRLQQVLVNLAVNARDAMESGGKITIRVDDVTLGPDDPARPPVLSAGPYVRIRVEDEGEGISPEVLPHVFEPFFTTKETGRGTGLGLATCHGIVKQSGGHIEVASRPGEGAVFTLYFPRTEEQPPRETPEATPVRDVEPGTILVVEDDAAVRRATAAILQEHGWSVLEAGGTEEALGVSGRHRGRIDVLLADLVMPDGSGVSLADRLTAERPETSVLFTSGYRRAGMDDSTARDRTMFLPKPFGPEGLLGKLAELQAS